MCFNFFSIVESKKEYKVAGIEVPKEVYFISIGLTFLLSLYLLYSIGKWVAKLFVKPKIVANPEENQIPANKKTILRQLAVSLKQNLSGWWFSDSEQLLEQAYLLPDNELIFLSNCYNEMYQIESGNTLYQDIQDKTIITWWGEDFQEKMLQRLTVLNLK